MSHLFYFVVPTDSPKEGKIILQGEEAHHAIHVVRIKIGEPIAFIDGQGGKWFGKVVDFSKDKLTAEIISYQYSTRSKKTVCLFIGWLHRDGAIETLLNYGTEIGISAFYFFQADRSTRPLRLSQKQKKWILQSCKTTGREWFPTVEAYPNLQQAISGFQGKLLIAAIQSSSISIHQVSDLSTCGLIVGPEGDLSEKELSIAKGAGAIPVHLGPYIYRTELSALLGSILIMQKQGQFDEPPEICSST